MKTFTPSSKEIVNDWILIDATDKVLGRVASLAAHRLRGKHKPTFAPHMDVGDFVVIINADKVRLTGSKLEDKQYYRHSGYPGGLKTTNAATVLSGRYPERVLQNAIIGMLPKNTLGRQLGRKLKIYAGDVHPHAGQKPQPLALD
ncbi:50S ribosomal protein L13 [Candidatus Magnetaquicoccaceae bacterium FCR-1]|uniref:Large ribosomal subunit protein uL13 n=1 Tax=Candidatus Magnetaquiglobus chichijimensis TaxID=3141448 RepID=A0ABQ0C6M5_9PROT